jgi:hypothetical protein
MFPWNYGFHFGAASYIFPGVLYGPGGVTTTS